MVCLTSDDNPDAWEESVWHKKLELHDVIACTPGVLSRVLGKGFVQAMPPHFFPFISIVYIKILLCSMKPYRSLQIIWSICSVLPAHSGGICTDIEVLALVCADERHRTDCLR